MRNVDYIKFFIAIVVILVIVIMVGIATAYLTAKSEWSGQIIGFDWRREWDKQRYMVTRGSCWNSGCEPDRAYDISYRSEIHHYDSVYVGQECNTDPDGKRSCTSVYEDVPVYKTRTYYHINGWRFGQTMVATGNTNNVSDLYYPDLGLNECDQNLVPGVGRNDPMLGCERPSTQRAFYFIRIMPHNKDINSARCQVNYFSWTDMFIEKLVRGSYWYHQNIIDCNDLKW